MSQQVTIFPDHCFICDVEITDDEKLDGQVQCNGDIFAHESCTRVRAPFVGKHGKRCFYLGFDVPIREMVTGESDWLRTESATGMPTLGRAAMLVDSEGRIFNVL